MVETENKVIQCRRDTAANWASNNPVPKAGEWCFETDTGITKIGDGSTAYNSLVPFRQTTATTTELNKLHSLSTTSTELGYVHGVTSAIQTQINSKFAKANIQTSFGETLSDEKVASEKLVKNSLDAKQDGITVANNSMLKASVLSAMNIVGENNSGRRYDEPKTYAKMESAAHSTFDLSKFTVMGTPTITSNGIASGFSANDKIDKPLSLTGTKLVAKAGFYYKVQSVSNAVISFLQGGTSAGYCYVSATGSIGLYTPATTAEYLFISTSEMTLVENDFIIATVEFNENSTSKITVINTTTGETLTKTGTAIWNKNIEDITSTYFGSSGSNIPYDGKIDLKYYSISVDGVEVFNGNQTGIDTIKPDDYTVVGTPTITEDGVASGFSSSNYIRKAIAINKTSKWAYTGVIPENLDLTTGFTGTIIGFNNSDYTRTYISNGKLYSTVIGATSESSAGNLVIDCNVTLTADMLGKKFETGFDGSHLYIKIDDTVVKQPMYSMNAGVTYIYIGSNSSHTYSYILNLDLNSIHFYDANGNLVYQPCLKIPYTLAANDKKFADIYYNERVKDMAEQFGVAPYTVIDGSNRAFILPYGSVDSKVGPKILVDSYYNGASSWEQYLDRTMIQRGTMTADTPVTFPCEDEFADTDFSLSCPYSAKSKTGFTPTVSGEYIAVGKF